MERESLLSLTDVLNDFECWIVYNWIRIDLKLEFKV